MRKRCLTWNKSFIRPSSGPPPHAFLTLRDANDGSHIMTQLLGSSADEEATSMYVASDYRLSAYVGGNSRGDLMGQSNAGQRDGFLFKYIDTSGPPSSPG